RKAVGFVGGGATEEDALHSANDDHAEPRVLVEVHGFTESLSRNRYVTLSESAKRRFPDLWYLDRTVPTICSHGNNSERIGWNGLGRCAPTSPAEGKPTLRHFRAV